MADHSKQHYYEAVDQGGHHGYGWAVYRYDASGNRRIVVAESGPCYETSEEALDAAVEWLDENEIEAELT